MTSAFDILLAGCVRLDPDRWQGLFLDCLLTGAWITPAPRPAAPVPAAWLRPLARAIQHIRAATARGASPEALRAMIDDIPALYALLDRDALAGALDAFMGTAAVSGAAWSLDRAAVAGENTLCLDVSDLLLLSAPSMTWGAWDEAAAKLASRTPVAAALRSAEWEDVPMALRDRAFWSARVESARLLLQMRDDLAGALDYSRDARGRGFDRDNFISRSRDLADKLGIVTEGDPSKLGGITDIRSVPRLGLIYDINVRQAQEWARLRADLTDGALEAYPAWRLVRVEPRAQPRPEAFWRGRWEAAGASVGWKWADDASMSALKTSPIWQALGALGPFGAPWPPFDWGSGMGCEDLTRAEAEQIGLLQPDAPAPRAEIPGFNDRLEADNLPADDAMLTRLRADFGDQVVIDSDRQRIAWAGDVAGNLYRDATSGRPSHTGVDFGNATPTAAAKMDAENMRTDVRLKMSAENIADLLRGRASLTRTDIESIIHVWRSPDKVTRSQASGRATFTAEIGGAVRSVEWQYSPQTRTVFPIGYINTPLPGQKERAA